jgi:hypothetical protein
VLPRGNKELVNKTRQLKFFGIYMKILQKLFYNTKIQFHTNKMLCTVHYINLTRSQFKSVCTSLYLKS